MCCRHTIMAKKRRNISINQLRLALITIFAVQFPNVLCIIFSQLNEVLAESDDVILNFKDIDFTNVTALDIVARRAMKRLHDDLDHDDDGNVSVSEGAKFLHRGEFKGHSGGDNLPGFETDKDGRITEVEFWDAWVNSPVHNWTVNEMTEWLSNDVGLPQYATKFKQYGIRGAAMPILASNSSVVLSLVDGSKEHRLKLWLKALDIVVCGYTRSKSSLLKDILLTISLALAIGGIMFGIHVRRNAALAVANMQDKLSNLQKELQKLDEEEDVVWMKDLSPSDEIVLDKTTEHSGSSSSLNSETSLYSRLTETQEELAETKNLLEIAEERLRMSEKRWSPPHRLLTCLKNTYQVEMKLHEFKRSQAQTKVEQATVQFQKMKKKVSVFSSIHFIHSRQVDSFDMEVQHAKDALRTVQRDFREKRKRWSELENLCHCKFMTSSVVTSPSIKLSKAKSPSASVSKSDVDIISRDGNSLSDHSAENLDQLGSLKEMPMHRPLSNSDVKSQKSMASCPSFGQLYENSQKQNANSLVRSSSDVNTRSPPSSLRNIVKISPTAEVQIIPTANITTVNNHTANDSEKTNPTSAATTETYNTFPRKTKTPKVERKTTIETSQPSRLSETIHIPNPIHSKLTSAANKSVSCHSLPDLLGEAKVNGKTGDKSPTMERKPRRGLTSIFRHRKKLK